jgi:hypothetical protein
VSGGPIAGLIPAASAQPSPPGDGLTAQQAAHDIVWTRTTAHLGGLAPDVTMMFSYLGQSRSIGYGSGEKPQVDRHSGAGINGDMDVWYSTRLWAVASGLRGLPTASSPLSADGRDACHVAQQTGVASISFTTAPDVARTLLDCPGVRVLPGQRIDGISAIKITGHGSQALWVNAATYLPIQVVSVYPASGAPASGETIQFGFLAPTARNLAYLATPVPPGFRKVTPVGPPYQSGARVPVTPWTPPAGVIPPFGMRPVAAGDTLTARQAAGDILWTRTTTRAIPASDTTIDSMFDYRSASRDLTYYPSGKPWDDSQTATIRGGHGTASYDTVVRYDKHTWSRQAIGDGTSPATTEPACVTATTTGLANIDYQATPDAARSLLSCQGQVVTRGLTLDGTGVIKIAGRQGETLYASATTYLPVEIILTEPSGQYPPAGFNGTPSPGRVIQYTWLPPTPANLAYVGIPIPAGFTQG